MWQRGITWLARHARSRYVRLLEEEVARLRTAGFPPLSLDEEVRRGPVTLPPVRRRSWTQLARERELAAGRSACQK
jgi:hypothetical protein